MNGSLKMRTSLDYPYLPSSRYLETPIHALVEIEPDPVPVTGTRPPLNLVLVIDASATMHHFHLTEEEREYWMGVAISRDELERGEADESDATYWTGQTLSEMQSIARTPMALATEAVKDLLTKLRPGDQISVIAFADRVHSVFNQQDWANFPDGCLTQMDLLRDRRLPVDIGTGTRMAEALRQASTSLSQNVLPHGVNRLIVISDGIVQDAEATLRAIGDLQSHGYAVTTIGLGEEFDEEFLTRVADNSRGEYYYAADSAEITQRLSQEMTTLQTTTVTDLYIAVRGLEGAVVQDLFSVRPAMTMFDEVHTEEGWLRARVGDVSSATPAGIIVQVAPPILPGGEHAVIEVLLTWTDPNGSPSSNAGNARAMIVAQFTDDPALLFQSDPEVQDLVDRYAVYKYEREAQRAQERGDLDTAREKLGAATRQLHKIGEDGLAAEMEGQIAGLGDASNPSRVKRIKATTRRLASIPTTETHAE